MRKHIILFYLLILSAYCFAQTVTKTVGIVYTAGAPAHAPAAKVGSQVAIDTVTWEWYEYNGSAWIASGDRIQSISGCSAPNYTPTKYQSRLVINACTAGQGGPELYYYTGGSWLQINEGQTYTAGSGISIAGNQISASDISPTNELQTLSISGSDLTLSDGGGTVTIPAGADGNGIYGGDGVLPSNVSVDGGGHNLSFLNILALSFGGDQLLFEAQDQSFLANNNILIKPTNDLSFEVEGTTTISTDNGLGFQYVDEYPEILTNDRSIPDVGLTKTLIASENGALGTGFTDGGGSGTIPASTTATAQGDFSLLGSATVADDAGIISIISGNSDEAKGGDFVLSAGNGASPGDFYMTAGNATAVDGLGGQLSILAGNNTNGFGGVLDLRAGNGGEAGGAVSITAGDGVTGTGGNVVLLPGNGSTDANNGKVIAYGNGIVLPSLTASERNAISILQVGTTIFTTNATATDGSTGVLQTWNGSTWKNHW